MGGTHVAYWGNEHAPQCPVTGARASAFTANLAGLFDREVYAGIHAELGAGGDDEHGNCTCGIIHHDERLAA